jgi:hypothetical protein
LNRGCFRDVIDGRLDDEVTGLRRVWRVAVKGRHGADNGYHRAPFFRQVAAILIEVGCITRVLEQVRLTTGGWGRRRLDIPR